MKTSKIYFLLPLLVILLSLSACTGRQSEAAKLTQIAEYVQTLEAMTPSASPTPEPSATPSPSPTATATPTPIAVGPTGFPTNVNPLTGLEVADPTILDRRPVTIKVSNWPRTGRPHAGLSFADIVYAYPIGNGMDRFLAIYYSQDTTKVGPIRSGRLVDRFLVNMYKGILAYAGADSNYVLPKLSGTLGWRAMMEGPNSCPAICRTGNGGIESVFGDTSAITKLADERVTKNKTAGTTDPGMNNDRQNLDGMRFESEVPSYAKDGSHVVSYLGPSNIADWRYDAASGKYLRWIDSESGTNPPPVVPLVDVLTNEQLGFSNVVYMFAEVKALNRYDSLHEITIYGGGLHGKALLFRDGKVIEGTWKSPSTQSPMLFLLPDGSQMPFKPGTSWITIFGQYSEVKDLGSGEYQIIYHQP